MRLKVEPFTGRVGGNQNTDGVFAGFGIECPLDGLTLFVWRWSMKDGDAIFGTIRACDRRLELLGCMSAFALVGWVSERSIGEFGPAALS
jgi:hypothetical protein